jgi:dephospho-CoA kinase
MISDKNRIALIGKSGAGKSTVARIIETTYNVPIVSTGAICRHIAEALFGNDHKASTQKIDDALTTIDESIFLKAALRDISTTTKVCVDSLRFLSDFRYAREKGFFILRVVAPDYLRLQRLRQRGQVFDPLKDGGHRSETELDSVDVDFQLANDSSIDATRIAVSALFAGVE